MQSFAVPYGDRGFDGSSSGVGRRLAAPYSAPPEDATTTRRHPAAMAADRMLTVPSTLMCASAAGSRHERLTPPCAARWRIAVGRHAGDGVSRRRLRDVRVLEVRRARAAGGTKRAEGRR